MVLDRPGHAVDAGRGAEDRSAGFREQLASVAFRHRGARALSFVFVLAATVKVFIFDVAELQGLWRVLSFLLMGLSFLGISWAYARFVFGIGAVRSGEPPPPAPPDTPAA